MADSALMLSISGLRGVIGQSLTPPVAARYGAAIGSCLGKGDHPHFVVGRDSRPSGEMVERAVVAGLVAVGCRVTMLGLATTPGTAIMVEQLKADGGVVITASHNPVIWNGVKALRHDGLAPPPEQAREIIDRFHQDDLRYVDVHGLQEVSRNDTTIAVHADRILPHIDVQAIRAAHLKVLLDCNHGAGGPETLHLLDRLGVEAVTLGAEPTGRFAHEAEPTRENLAGVAGQVLGCGAAVGFAQDPDADRLALIDETGRYIGEEYTLALCAMHALGSNLKSEISNLKATVVANLSTSRMIDDIATRFGASCIRTPVGEANVASAMRRARATIGGEGNGGVILPGITLVRDSLVGIALVLEMLATTGRKLGELVAQIPSYSIVKEKLPIQPGMAERAIERLGLEFRTERIDLQDGIRVDLDSTRSWVHVRPSNTEPILRIIAEAPDEVKAAELIRRCRAVVAG